MEKHEPYGNAEVDFSDAKVGDRVWSPLTGWAEIESINLNDSYPIKLANDNKSFMLDGKYMSDDIAPTLFKGMPEIKMPAEPIKRVRYVNLYAKGNIGGNYATREEALSMVKHSSENPYIDTHEIAWLVQPKDQEY